MNRSQLAQIFKESFKQWRTHNAPITAAALTFFVILPLPSILLIALTILTHFYGQMQAQQQLVQQITAFAGPAVAQLFKQLLLNASSPFTSVWTTIFVLAFAIGGAVGAFAVLRDTMDVIWNVKVAKTKKLTQRIQEKIGPFAIVTVLGLITIAWTALANSLFKIIVIFSINGLLTAITLIVAQILLSLAIAALLFALTYKLIPEARVHWKDVGLAAVATSFAFIIANYILGAYVQTFTVTTVAGAAGSLMFILLWIYILTNIVLFGAEISRAYATIIPHEGKHLPLTAQKIVEPFSKAGRKLEEAAKGQVKENSKEDAKPKEEENNLKQPPALPSKKKEQDEED